jgi:SAM-dependent methyltransferase
MAFSQSRITRLVLIASLFARCGDAFSLPDDNNSEKTTESFFSRRDLLWRAPVGAALTYGYGRLIYNALSVQGSSYPSAHEERVASTVSTALAAGVSPAARGPYRILEVGIGSECRVICRGLYTQGLRQLTQHQGVQEVQVKGVDLQPPKQKFLTEARQRLSEFPLVQLDVGKGDITTRLDYPDGHFDSILCFLTLCSVTDQEATLSELKRLIRPDGGTLGYVEHVAVNPDEKSRSFLESQQRLFDPLQQRLADNCHLHRYTQDAILSAFGITDGKSTEAQLLQSERFFVDSMWPVSSQCCGVVQRTMA